MGGWGGGGGLISASAVPFHGEMDKEKMLSEPTLNEWFMPRAGRGAMGPMERLGSHSRASSSSRMYHYEDLAPST